MLGKKIAELRKKRGLSQYQLAKELGFSRGKLANYEQGSRQPDYETLSLIASYFNVSVDYLLGNETPRSGLGLRGLVPLLSKIDLSENNNVLYYKGERISKEELYLIQTTIEAHRKIKNKDTP